VTASPTPDTNRTILLRVADRAPGYLKWVAARYNRLLGGSLFVSLLVSGLIYWLQSKGRLPNWWWVDPLLPWAIGLALVVGGLLAHRWRLHQQFHSLHIDQMVARWTICNAAGDISADFFYRDVANDSEHPESEFRPDREGFLQSVPDYKPTFQIIAGSNARRISITSVAASEQDLNIKARAMKVHIYEHTIRFDPPLEGGSKASIWRSYDVKGSEAAALTASGTHAGVRVFYPTRLLRMQLRAPSHYAIECVTYDIIDHDNQSRATELRRVPAPTISDDGARLDWTILYPNSQYRYVFRYRLAAIT